MDFHLDTSLREPLVEEVDDTVALDQVTEVEAVENVPHEGVTHDGVDAHPTNVQPPPPGVDQLPPLRVEQLPPPGMGQPPPPAGAQQQPSGMAPLHEDDLDKSKKLTNILHTLRNLPGHPSVLFIGDSTLTKVDGKDVDPDSDTCRVRSVGGLCINATAFALTNHKLVHRKFKRVAFILGINDCIHAHQHCIEDRTKHLKVLYREASRIFPKAQVSFVPPFQGLKGVSKSFIDELAGDVAYACPKMELLIPPAMSRRKIGRSGIHLTKIGRSEFLGFLTAKFVVPRQRSFSLISGRRAPQPSQPVDHDPNQHARTVDPNLRARADEPEQRSSADDLNQHAHVLPNQRTRAGSFRVPFRAPGRDQTPASRRDQSNSAPPSDPHIDQHRPRAESFRVPIRPPGRDQTPPSRRDQPNLAPPSDPCTDQHRPDCAPQNFRGPNYTHDIAAIVSETLRNHDMFYRWPSRNRDGCSYCSR